jgi:hypothetical protein
MRRSRTGWPSRRGTQQDGSCRRQGAQRHDAHHSGYATVLYRWHPLYGQSLRVLKRMRDSRGEHIFCELPDSTICSLPEWVFSPECATFSVGPPLICTAALLELRDLLTAWHLSTDCVKPSGEETPPEVVRDSTFQAAGFTAEPTTRRCAEDDHTGLPTTGAVSRARGASNRGSPGKQPTRRRRR